MTERQAPGDNRVAIFLDLASLNSAASAAGVRYDLARLNEIAAAGRPVHRALAYIAIDPHGPSTQADLTALRDAGFRAVSKPMRQLADGSLRGDMGVDIAVDMVVSAERCDVLVLVSGDGDLLPAVRVAQSKGARVELVACPGQEAGALVEAADLSFTLADLEDKIVMRGGPEARAGRGRFPAGERKEWPTPPPPPPSESLRPRRGEREQRPPPAGMPREESRPVAPHRFRTLEGEKLSGKVIGGSDAGADPPSAEGS